MAPVRRRRSGYAGPDEPSRWETFPYWAVLLSVLAVGEVTLRARQYAAGSFRFRESYVVLVFIYVTLVLGLSFLLSRLERRLRRGEPALR